MPSNSQNNIDSKRPSVKLENSGLTFIIGFGALLVFQLLGEISIRLLQLPIPGPVLGLSYMLIFLIAYNKMGKPEPHNLVSVSSSLLAHLSLLFIPACVGIITMIDKIASQWQPILAALFIGSLVTLSVTAFSLKLLFKLFKQAEPE